MKIFVLITRHGVCNGHGDYSQINAIKHPIAFTNKEDAINYDIEYEIKKDAFSANPLGVDAIKTRHKKYPPIVVELDLMAD